MYYQDFIDVAFGGDFSFNDVLKSLGNASDMMGVNRWKDRPQYIVLSNEQQTRALAEGKLQIDDIILSRFGNDFDFGTIVKSLKRAYESIQGRGKEGADTGYNLNKVMYSINQINKRTCGIKYFESCMISLEVLIHNNK